MSHPPSDGADGGRHRAHAGPGSDRATTFVVVERGADERETTRRKQSSADPLERARCDEQRRIWRDPAENGCDREQVDADQEDALAAELVADRAPDEDERAVEQRVRLDHPLHVGDRGAEVGLERGKRDVDGRAVDERQARREDRGDQRPLLG